METGIDPLLNHAAPPTPSRYKTKEKTPEATSKTESKKRTAEESPGNEKRASKKVKTRRVRKSKSPNVEGGSSPAEAETGIQVDPAMQVCRYLLEMFSVPLLRFHATVCLVDRDRLQLYHANRSVILVSSAINFSSGDGLDKFIALVIAFRCLSLTQSGIMESFVDENTELVTDPEVERDYKLIHMRNKIKISHGSEKKMTLTLDRVISRDPSAIGCSTTVAQAKSDEWPDDNLVVKILALSVFGILFVRVRRPSRLLKIVFPLLLPSVCSLRLRVSRSTSCSTFHTHYVLVTVSRIVCQLDKSNRL